MRLLDITSAVDRAVGRNRLRDVKDQIPSVDPDQRPYAWRNLCGEAVRYEESLATRAGINALVVDSQIRRWSSVLP